MSLEQPAGGRPSSKSQRKTCFTIDSILDTSPARLVTEDEKSVTSFVVPSDDELASAADRDDSGGSLPLCSAAEPHQPDEELNLTTTDHVDGKLEGIGEGSTADEETEQRTAECSSLLARTAAAYHRRRQRHVAQLRSFSELLLAQYQLQYQRQLGNHFRHHSAQQPSNISVFPSPLPPPPERSISGFDYRRDLPDVERSTLNDALQWNLHGHDSQSPTSTSTSVKPRTSRPASGTVDWSAVDHRALPLMQGGRFVDESTVHHATTPQTSTALVDVYHDNETLDKYSVVDCSSDRNQSKWTTSNNIGIRLLSCFSHAHVQK